MMVRLRVDSIESFLGLQTLESTNDERSTVKPFYPIQASSLQAYNTPLYIVPGPRLRMHTSYIIHVAIYLEHTSVLPVCTPITWSSWYYR